eukprot:2371015-Prymnesium_polylepis.1
MCTGTASPLPLAACPCSRRTAVGLLPRPTRGCCAAAWSAGERLCCCCCRCGSLSPACCAQWLEP